MTKSLLKLLNSTVYYLKIAYDKGFFYLFGANVLTAFLAFGAQFFVAWWMTPRDIGLIRLMQGFLGVGSVIAGFGLGSSVLKLCSEIRKQSEKIFLLKKAIKYTIVVSFIVFVIMIITSSVFYGGRVGVFGESIYFVSIIPLSLNALLINYYRAIKEFKKVGIIQVIIKVISILILLLFVYFWGLNGFFCAILGSVLVSFLLLYSKVDLSKFCKINSPFKLHFDIAKYAVSTNGVGQILIYVDIFVINTLVLDKSMIGQYSFATIVLLGLNILRSTIQQIVTPYLSEKSSNVNVWIKAFKRYNVVLYIVTFGVVIIGYLVVPPLITRIFSGKYNDAIPFFKILLFAYGLRNLNCVSGSALFSIGGIKYNFYNSVILLFVNLIVTIWFTKIMGIMGAAYAQLVYSIFSYILVTVVFYFYSKLLITKNLAVS